MAKYKDLSLDRNDNLIEIIDVDSINNALKNIFSTPLGSVPGKPKYGTRIFSLLFNQMDYLLEFTLKEIIKEEIGKFEPRIKFEDVQITEVPEYNRVDVEIFYSFSIGGDILSASANIGFSQ